MSFKQKLSKIIIIFRHLPRALAERAFLFFLGLVLLGFLLAGFLFYRYYISVQKKELSPPEEQVMLKQDLIDKVVQIWQTREQNFKMIGEEKYLDPFQESRAEFQESEPAAIDKANEREQEQKQEQAATEHSDNITALLKASTLAEFYELKGEALPSANQRGEMWQEKGLGSKEQYVGSDYQNWQLLEALKKEL